MPNIEVSETAFDFLKSLARPLEDTTVTVVDRLIKDYQLLKEIPKSHGTNEQRMMFSLDDVPSVKFTSIIKAKVAGKPASGNFWNSILEDVITACAENGRTRKELRDCMTANVQFGEHSDNGYRYVPAAKMSFQGLEANRSFKNIIALARAFEIPIEIDIRWQDNEEAALPNQTAKFKHP